MSKARDDRDWALLEFADGWLLRQINTLAKQPLVEMPFLNPSSGAEIWRGREVVVLTGQTWNPVRSNSNEIATIETVAEASKRRRKGRLGREPSFLLLSSGTEFTKVLTLDFADGTGGLNAGDCGSWVIDAAANVLYGHVVASDDLGEVYVVPIESIIEDVKEALNASAVTLPSIHDLYEFAATSNSLLSTEYVNM